MIASFVRLTDVILSFQSPNQLVIWDDIIQSKDEAYVNLKKQFPEYIAYDIKQKIR
jgi:hypothetical protein